jgi:hypothetical protein
MTTMEHPLHLAEVDRVGMEMQVTRGRHGRGNSGTHHVSMGLHVSMPHLHQSLPVAQSGLPS